MVYTRCTFLDCYMLQCIFSTAGLGKLPYFTCHIIKKAEVKCSRVLTHASTRISLCSNLYTRMYNLQEAWGHIHMDHYYFVRMIHLLWQLWFSALPAHFHWLACSELHVIRRISWNGLGVDMRLQKLSDSKTCLHYQRHPRWQRVQPVGDLDHSPRIHADVDLKK
jgi:hypothetical protein